MTGQAIKALNTGQAHTTTVTVQVGDLLRLRLTLSQAEHLPDDARIDVGYPGEFFSSPIAVRSHMQPG